MQSYELNKSFYELNNVTRLNQISCKNNFNYKPDNLNGLSENTSFDINRCIINQNEKNQVISCLKAMVNNIQNNINHVAIKDQFNSNINTIALRVKMQVQNLLDDISYNLSLKLFNQIALTLASSTNSYNLNNTLSNNNAYILFIFANIAFFKQKIKIKDKSLKKAFKDKKYKDYKFNKDSLSFIDNAQEYIV